MARPGLIACAIIAATVLVGTSAPCDPAPVPAPVPWHIQIVPPVAVDRGILVVPAPSGPTVPTILQMHVAPEVIKATVNGTVKMPVTWPPGSPERVAPGHFNFGGSGGYDATPLAPDRFGGSGGYDRPPLVEPKLDLRGLREWAKPR